MGLIKRVYPQDEQLIRNCYFMEMRLQYRDFIVINTWYETAVKITFMRDRVSKAFAPWTGALTCLP